MKKTPAKTGPKGFAIEVFLLELALYAVLVTIYFFLVLHFLGDWLKHLFDQRRTAYAFTALGLIIGQGVILEMLTSALLRLMRWRPAWGKR